MDLLPGNEIDLEGVKAAIGPKTKICALQRSRGYTFRNAMTIPQIEAWAAACKFVKSDVICMVDNCYGEFTDVKEPVQAGADIMAGSLIKNPGGGLALSGGYVVGRKDLVDKVATRVTSPGIGGECGLTFGQTRSMFQGLFIAPRVTMGAVMELIPRITSLFIEGLKPVAEKTQEVVKRKFNGKKVYIGMSPAVVIGHPTTLVVSLLLIPVALGLAVVLPGNQFLPLASLAGMFYLFPIVLPFTKGNVVKTFIIGLVALAFGLYFVTDMAPAFTQAAATVFAQTGDPAAKIPEGFDGGALDFASSLFGWVIYKCVNNLQWVGMGVLTLVTLAMVAWNRKRIVAEEKKGA